jgi:hypothetical protein
MLLQERMPNQREASRFLKWLNGRLLANTVAGKRMLAIFFAVTINRSSHDGGLSMRRVRRVE